MKILRDINSKSNIYGGNIYCYQDVADIFDIDKDIQTGSVVLYLNRICIVRGIYTDDTSMCDLRIPKYDNTFDYIPAKVTDLEKIIMPKSIATEVLRYLGVEMAEITDEQEIKRIKEVREEWRTRKEQ